MEKNLKDKTQNTDSKNDTPKESPESLKTESTKTNPEQKGYNEHNPTQKSGAFTPDSKTGNKE